MTTSIQRKTWISHQKAVHLSTHWPMAKRGQLVPVTWNDTPHWLGWISGMGWYVQPDN